MSIFLVYMYMVCLHINELATDCHESVEVASPLAVDSKDIFCISGYHLALTCTTGKASCSRAAVR